MKIILLDIDGVLAIGDHLTRLASAGKDIPEDELIFQEFDPDTVQELNRITDATDARLVISSTWRFNGEDRLRTLFEARGIKGHIIGMTSLLPNPNDRRGHEIEHYLERHKVEAYVILDDDSDMRPKQMDRLVKCDSKTGLTTELADKAIKLLGTIS